jgi:hypothetical protein
MKRLLDRDPLTGIETYFEHDNKTGVNTVETIQNIEPILDRNKRIAENLNKKEDWWHIGTIPDMLVLEWAKESGHKPYSKPWHVYAMKQMNKPEYSKLNPNRIKL